MGSKMVLKGFENGALVDGLSFLSVPTFSSDGRIEKLHCAD